MFSGKIMERRGGGDVSGKSVEVQTRDGVGGKVIEEGISSGIDEGSALEVSGIVMAVFLSDSKNQEEKNSNNSNKEQQR